MKRIESEVSVIGSGAAGLWAAKELVDSGYEVTVFEQANKLAPGASTRNEGWLHAGTYHAVGIVDRNDAEAVVERTIYGHRAVVEFAPETINESRSIAFTYDRELAHRALDRWSDFGVSFEPLSPTALRDEGIKTNDVVAAFEVGDKSVDTRALYQKLARYIIARGGNIIVGTAFRAVEDNVGEVSVNGELIAVNSELFIATAGAGLRDISRDVTGTSLSMRFYKAHLLVGPKLTDKNCFSLDIGEPGIMNHKRASVIGINRDGIELESPDYAVNLEKEALLHEALARVMEDRAVGASAHESMQTVACCKPDVYVSTNDIQNLNAQVFSLSPSYIGALPGKMTETPFLATQIRSKVAEVLGPRGDAEVAVLYSDEIGDKDIDVMQRPADVWPEQLGIAS